MANPRRPVASARLVGQRNTFLNNRGMVGYRMWTSDDMRRLLYPQRPGSTAVSQVNQLHREMANEITIRAQREYWKARRKRRNQRRDARRPEYKMERELRLMAEAPGRGHPVYKDPEGFTDGIKAGNGFMVDFTVMDRSVISPKGFPYWRSLEFGYGSFTAIRPMFNTSPTVSGGSWIPPTRVHYAHMDPRMPQNVGFAPVETVTIRPFEGYHFLETAMKKSRVSPQLYMQDVAASLPRGWAQAIDMLGAGAQFGGSPRRLTRWGAGATGGSPGAFLSDPRF